MTVGKRVVLPAFGAYAGGLDVFAPPLRALFPGGPSRPSCSARRGVIGVDHTRLRAIPA
ncbi:MAG: hypothetical protein WDO24_02880 [Pseudomonadota bacterium]